MAVSLLAMLLAFAVETPCDPGCERSVALELIERGEARTAVERVKEAQTRFPDDPSLPLALAKAYMADDNLFWAERTLREAVSLRPDDTLSRMWLAWVHLRQGDPDLADAVLDPSLAPARGPEEARWRLLEGFRASLGGERERARQALALVPRSSQVFPEDRDLWLHLHRREDPLWLDPLRGNVELSAGMTSNALAGSPTDPDEPGGSSGLASTDMLLRVVPPGPRSVRPSFELSLRGHGIAAEEYRELSYLELSGRFGGTAVWLGRRWLVAYRGEVLWLDQDDPRYSEAHRAEVEMEGKQGLVFFGGAGHRWYRDARRTRWEVDLGAGGPMGSKGSVAFAWGAIGRAMNASSPAYDQLGVTAIVLTRVRLGAGFAARVTGTLTYDGYPNSGGREGLLAFGTAKRRRDLLGKLGLLLWGPSWHGIRPALSWQVTRRDSTADDAPGSSFSFRENRALALVRVVFGSDPWAPERVAPPDHVPLDYGLGDGVAAAGNESIVELLRRDEELRRASSCGVR